MRAEEPHGALPLAPAVRDALIPTDLPEIDGIQYAIDALPQDGVLGLGGDFVDVFRRDGSFGMCWGDATGSGREAAVTGVMAKYMLKGLAFRHASPATLLFHLNRALSHTLDDESFVALAYGTYDPHTRSLTMAACGTYPPVLVREGEAAEIVTPGPLLGVLHDQQYRQAEIPLQQGDVVVGFTDGVAEARRGGDMFGSARVREVVEANPDRGESELSDMIITRARRFAGGDLSDDALVFVLKVQPATDAHPVVVRRRAAPGGGG